MEFTASDRAILTIEASSYAHTVDKEAIIAETLGISSVRYYQRLRRLIPTRAAIEFDPLLVKRLRRHLDVTALSPR